MDLLKFQEIALQASKAAGEILLKYYGANNLIEIKSDNSPVTIADTESEREIIEIISKNFPNHSILGEESGSKEHDSEYLWVIDPLDGTSNFSNTIPYFCSSICLLKNKIPIVAVIYDPIHHDLFTACKGLGTYLNGEKIFLGNKNLPKTFYVSLVYTRSKEKKPEVDEIFKKLNPPEYRMRNMGAAALELSYVAAGKLQAILVNGNNPWDVCGGILLILEAGGFVTDFDDQPWTFQSKNIIAGHPVMQKKLSKVLKTPK